jgi:hypothetical protein
MVKPQCLNQVEDFLFPLGTTDKQEANGQTIQNNQTMFQLSRLKGVDLDHFLTG